jgi:MurNAc alpha-1-phosphate uridylyltransferase
MRPDSALLFAAGLGTRMAPLTERLPKPLVEVAGRPLFDHALALLRQGGVGHIVSNTHYLPDLMGAHLARHGIPESREKVLLDTGGGLRRALPLLRGEAVFTLNTDAVWTGDNPVAALRAAWDPARMDGLMLLVERERAVGHAGKGDVLVQEDGSLRWGPGLVYTGLQIVRTDWFARQDEEVFGMRRAWDAMMAEGRLHGVVHRGGWCDVGRPESIALAEDMLENAHV